MRVEMLIKELEKYTEVCGNCKNCKYNNKCSRIEAIPSDFINNIKLMCKHIGKPISETTIDELKKELEKYYNNEKCSNNKCKECEYNKICNKMIFDNDEIIKDIDILCDIIKQSNNKEDLLS